MKHFSFAVLFIAGVICSRCLWASEKPLKVFVCAGQSNMVGRRCVIAELPESLQQVQESNLYFNGKSWIPVEAGKTEKIGFGPELSFAQRISQLLGEPVGIVKQSLGATNLAVNWSPTTNKQQYDRMVEKVKLAQASRPIEIVGMIWMQGEADARIEEMATAYEKNLSTFIESCRKDFHTPQMIFVSGRINCFFPDKYLYIEKVRKAQENCKVSNYGFIDCDDFPKGSDDLHYNAQGMVEMGYRFADKIFDLMNREVDSQN